MKKRIDDLKSQLEYENRPGSHTFSMCECGRKGCRRYKCILCLKEEIEKLERKNK